MKITKKVSINIASEASYVYIFSGQKLVKNAKNGSFWRVFQDLKLVCQTVLPDKSILKGQKLMENAKIQEFLGDFQTMCHASEASYYRKFWLFLARKFKQK